MDLLLGEAGEALLVELELFDYNALGIEAKRAMQNIIQRFVDLIRDDADDLTWRRHFVSNAIGATMLGWYDAAAAALEVPLMHPTIDCPRRQVPTLREIDQRLVGLRRAPARSGGALYYEH